MDDTDSATLVIFDRDAAMLFNRSCAEVLRNRDMRVGHGVLPPEIQALVNSTYLFKVVMLALCAQSNYQALLVMCLRHLLIWCMSSTVQSVSSSSQTTHSMSIPVRVFFPELLGQLKSPSDGHVVASTGDDLEIRPENIDNPNPAHEDHNADISD
ncbi:replication protein A 70 kDa DNA-binding subunit [Trifolium pratense]|uniref:Replication protein A 70 kDa DNA-binding subunit n=1 Tax=Trifolium pratense TaxID=57577 RepID=A0A2K3NG84_TRIPR|nr:replication protein A 70 kDa DNA-binding subunit [Trifolium pratense]